MFKALRKGPLSVAIIGGGNWGSACAKVCAQNTSTSYIFEDVVRFWVRNERAKGVTSLATEINTTRENKKYLPGIRLPDNIVAVEDLVETCRDADMLVFVLPHQFLTSVCATLKGNIKPTAMGISLIKGIHVEEGTPRTFTEYIEDVLEIDMCALSGANVAMDIAKEEFSETTIGFKDDSHSEVAAVWQQLFDTNYFKVNCIPDVIGVQVNGALKNLVALSAGFCDGLGLGSNAKSAIIRTGVQEIMRFCGVFFPTVTEDVFFESAGFADVITTCIGGRNVRCAAEFARRGGSKTGVQWKDVEEDLLGGSKMQGQLTCLEVMSVLKKFDIQDQFPLFKSTYEVAFEGYDSQHMIDTLCTAEPGVIKANKDSSPINVLLSPSLSYLRRCHSPTSM